MSNEIFSLGLSELADKIRSREFSSAQVVQAHCTRLQEVNPKLNALVEDRFAQAAKEAELADQLIERTLPLGPQALRTLAETKPLLGVPFTIKEMIAVEGMKSTLGSIHRKNNIQRRDATVVERLKSAGAILLGTTNVPEVGFWFECGNTIYGRTNNPYDTHRTCGGSSGGEAALVGAGASPFGVGSDIGGSIRIPAFFCGIFGHKPSNGLIPITGHTPLYFDNAKDFEGSRHPLTTLGPLCRRASDLRLVMNLLLGPDGFDSEVQEFTLPANITDWSKIKVYTLSQPDIHGVSVVEEDLVQSVELAARYLEQLGATVIELDAKIFLAAFRLWTAAVSSIEGRDFNSSLNPSGSKINFPKEFSKIFMGRGDYTLPALLTAALEISTAESRDLEADLAELKTLQQKLTELLGQDGILLMPPHPRKAPLHYTPILRPFDFCYTGIVNALRFPASTIPMGLAENGLPLGVQVVAGDRQDHLCLSACETLEQGFGGWRMADI